MSNGNPWTQERVEELRKLWADGLSALLVARAMNCGISRNAVIGKIHRLGIAGRGQPTQHAPRTRSQTQRDNSLKMRMRRPKREVRPRPVLPVQAIPPGSRPVRFMDRMSGQCAWILSPEGTPIERLEVCGSPCLPMPDPQDCLFHHNAGHFV